MGCEKKFWGTQGPGAAGGMESGLRPPKPPGSWEVPAAWEGGGPGPAEGSGEPSAYSPEPPWEGVLTHGGAPSPTEPPDR